MQPFCITRPIRLLCSVTAIVLCYAVSKTVALAGPTPLDDAYLSTALALHSRLIASSYLQKLRYPGYIQFPCHEAKSKISALLSDAQCLAICVHTHAVPEVGPDYKRYHDALIAVNFKECAFSETRACPSEDERQQARDVEVNHTNGTLQSDYVSKLTLLFTWKKDTLPMLQELCETVSGTENFVSNETCRTVCERLYPLSAITYLFPLFPKCSGLPGTKSVSSSSLSRSTTTLKFPYPELTELYFEDTQSFYWYLYKDRVQHLLSHHMLKMIENPAEVSLNSIDKTLMIQDYSWWSYSRSLNTCIIQDCSCALLCNMLVPFFPKTLLSFQSSTPLCNFGREQRCLLPTLTHPQILFPQYVWEAHVFEAYFQVRKKRRCFGVSAGN